VFNYSIARWISDCWGYRGKPGRELHADPGGAVPIGGAGGFLTALEQRIVTRGHAVIAAAEGAGQELLGNTGNERDPSGNIRLHRFE
jgi:6-phosphofructokinase 1